jgi:DNA end-binding protein Ku
MAHHATWQGHLKLSLVTCPVALYAATDAGSEVHFNLINPETLNRIKMQTVDPDTGPIERSKLVKGYEVEKGQYVLLTDEEIKSVRLESTKTIDIDRFVPADQIDRVYWDTPYYVAPDGKMGEEPFAVIREAMRRSGQIAIGRVVIGVRERIVALEPRGQGILAYTLRTDDEVRKPDALFSGLSSAKPDPAMIDIAEKIIAQREGPFDPSQFVDRYEAALKTLIAAKKKGAKVKVVAEPEDTNVIDLMAALRASLEGKDKPAAPAAKTAPKKAKSPAAKKPARKAS